MSGGEIRDWQQVIKIRGEILICKLLRKLLIFRVEDDIWLALSVDFSDLVEVCSLRTLMF